MHDRADRDTVERGRRGISSNGGRSRTPASNPGGCLVDGWARVRLRLGTESRARSRFASDADRPTRASSLSPPCTSPLFSFYRADNDRIKRAGSIDGPVAGMAARFARTVPGRQETCIPAQSATNLRGKASLRPVVLQSLPSLHRSGVREAFLCNSARVIRPETPRPTAPTWPAGASSGHVASRPRGQLGCPRATPAAARVHDPHRQGPPRAPADSRQQRGDRR